MDRLTEQLAQTVFFEISNSFESLVVTIQKL